MGEDVPAALFSFSKLKLATSRSKALREGMKRSICMTTLSQKVHTAGINRSCSIVGKPNPPVAWASCCSCCSCLESCTPSPHCCVKARRASVGPWWCECKACALFVCENWLTKAKREHGEAFDCLRLSTCVFARQQGSSLTVVQREKKASSSLRQLGFVLSRQGCFRIDPGSFYHISLVRNSKCSTRKPREEYNSLARLLTQSCISVFRDQWASRKDQDIFRRTGGCFGSHAGMSNSIHTQLHK